MNLGAQQWQHWVAADRILNIQFYVCVYVWFIVYVLKCIIFGLPTMRLRLHKL